MSIMSWKKWYKDVTAQHEYIMSKSIRMRKEREQLMIKVDTVLTAISIIVIVLIGTIVYLGVVE